MRCRTTRSAVPCVPPLTSLPPVLKYFSVPPVALRQIDLGRARMAYVACGYRHTLAISDEGALFAFGWNACVASLQTRNRPCTMQPTRCNMHRATCNMQPTLMQHVSMQIAIRHSSTLRVRIACHSALRHSRTAACLCNAVSTHGAFAEHAPINRPVQWYAHGSDVCFRLCTATGNSASKEVRIRFPFDAHGNDRKLHSYRCHVWSRSHRLRVGCFAVLLARAEALAHARGCRSNGRIRNPEIRR